MIVVLVFCVYHESILLPCTHTRAHGHKHAQTPTHTDKHTNTCVFVTPLCTNSLDALQWESHRQAATPRWIDSCPAGPQSHPI